MTTNNVSVQYSDGGFLPDIFLLLTPRLFSESFSLF